LEKCQEHDKTKVSEVTAVTTHSYEEYEEEEDGVNLNVEFCVEDIECKLGEDGRIPESWILLVNQSTINVFNNKHLLTNIRKVSREIKINCNAGTSTTNIVGDYCMVSQTSIIKYPVPC